MNVAILPQIAKRSPGLARFLGRKTLEVRKNAPHIFFAAGIAGSVTSTVMACRATLKLPDTLDEIQHDIDLVKEIHKDHNDPNYPRKNSNEDVAKDTVYVYAKAVSKLGRLYGPSMAVGVVSISALSGAHINLTRRNTALMAAYTTLSTAFDNYRDRVEQQYGRDEELDLYHAKVAEKEHEGESEVVPVVDSGKWSPYARFFDEGSPHWVKNAEYNKLFLDCQQNWANDRLRARGHLFLNEVYDMVGIPRTKEGSVVGWFIGDNADPNADGYVEFGHYNATDFINGYEPRVILDFNVDGVIFDKL